MIQLNITISEEPNSVLQVNRRVSGEAPSQHECALLNRFLETLTRETSDYSIRLGGGEVVKTVHRPLPECLGGKPA